MGNPLFKTDFYKTGHIHQYPKNTEMVYLNFTPRSDRLAVKLDNVYDGKVVFFGLQGFIQQFLIEDFNTNFFNKPKADVVADYQRMMDNGLGPGVIGTDHIEKLHDLGYLPISIKALPEGSRVGIKVPMLTVCNTLTQFYWVPGYLESVLSSGLWSSCTVATIALQYRTLLDNYADKTGASKEFVCWQGHDFSYRGRVGVSDPAASCAGHLLSFLGTDTIPAIEYLETYYKGRETFVGGSVPATEHSVMGVGGKDTEVDTFRRLITEVYPSGIVSIVSDTWDFWNVITNTANTLKEEILDRKENALGQAKVVFRPDSGDPVDIICGNLNLIKLEATSLNEAKEQALDIISERVGASTPHGKYGGAEHEGYFEFEAKIYKAQIYIEWDRYDKQYYFIEESRLNSFEEVQLTPKHKGAVECLWDIFGGTVNAKGYKELNPRVGLIYGDSITLERAEAILKKLEAKGFASSNIVFGIGSYTYQYNTRDTFGFAVKCTATTVDGQDFEVYKDPVTDNGTKKSAKGLLRVEKEGEDFILFDQQTREQEAQGELKLVFENGIMYGTQSLEQIRATLHPTI